MHYLKISSIPSKNIDSPQPPILSSRHFSLSSSVFLLENNLQTLTNGADCSGFVQSVYNNFGVSLPRTSYEQQNAGREVSYSEAQPGDLICYGGHVAIYMGNGKIVHASNSRDGIKVSDNAAYRTILSVRRLV